MNGALATLRRVFAPLIALQPSQRRDLYKMGDKSEAFCRQTLSALKLYPNIVPPSVDIATAEVDLATLDQLRPRFQRLYNLAKRADDSELALDLLVTLGADSLDVLELLDRLERAVLAAIVEDRLRLGRPDAGERDQLVLGCRVEIDRGGSRE